MHSPFFHYYDAQVIGSAALGQLVHFDSLLCSNSGQGRYRTQVKLRPDVTLVPSQIEDSDAFCLDLNHGASEYEWSRKAEHLFGLPATLHIGIGNTSTLDNFIRFALYRCLSGLPHTGIGESYHALDLVTTLRALLLLRPHTVSMDLDPAWSEHKFRAVLFERHNRESRADTVKDVFEVMAKANPKFARYAMAHSSTRMIEQKLGLVGGQIESLTSLKPVFICHEGLADPKRWGIYLAMGTDPHYANMVYVVDLQANLGGLLGDAGQNVNQFIRVNPNHQEKPILRLNINRLPFVSPLSVLSPETLKLLEVDPRMIEENAKRLKMQQDLCLSLLELSMGSEVSLTADPDFQLYGSEYLEADKSLLKELHKHPMSAWEQFLPLAHDVRIKSLGMRLISRFAPTLLGEGDLSHWNAHCADRLVGKLSIEGIDAVLRYCIDALATEGVPAGIRSAARHWLVTTGNRQ